MENKLKRSDVWQREELNKYLSKFECEKCKGTRLKTEALAVKIRNKNISEITNISIERLFAMVFRSRKIVIRIQKKKFQIE